MTFALELKDRFASEFLEANEREALLRESGVALENLISGKGKGREFLGGFICLGRFDPNRSREFLPKPNEFEDNRIRSF